MPVPPRRTSVASRKKKPAPSSQPARQPQEHPFPVVGIGASAGGLEAMRRFLTHLTPEPPCALVLLTHQARHTKTSLHALLQKFTPLPIHELARNSILQPGHLYVVPPGTIPAFKKTGIRLRPAPSAAGKGRPPIDAFLTSLAARFGTCSAAVLLSGAGTDGTRGAAAVRGVGGLVLTQDPSTAEFAGMPSAVVRAGLAKHVLAPELLGSQIPELLRQHLPSHPFSKTPATLQRILNLLRVRTGNDFSDYKPSTIHRRIQRRIQISGCGNWDDYAALLEKNPPEIDSLLADFLIRVTRFFRDPDAFETLGQRLLPTLIQQRPENHSFRAWVPGCATGEEVFSLSILLRESLDAVLHTGPVKIFGTDLDTHAIDTARTGRYSKKDASHIAPQRLRRFFTVTGDHIQIRKEIRDHTIFSIQNVIKDPPFIRLDLISCRNLLIYLNPELQARLLPIFHYALNPGGILMLGSSETIGRFTDLFEVVDKKWKIFRRSELPGFTPRIQKSPGSHPASAPPPKSSALIKPIKNNVLGETLERLLLQRFCPAAVLCSPDGSVLYFHGKTGAYLEPAAGRPRLNLLEMARPGLQIELAAALRRVSDQGGHAERCCPSVRGTHKSASVQFTVSRLEETGELRGLLLVTFRTVPKNQGQLPAQNRKNSALNPVETLERELQDTRESLRATIEELQTSNEEFRSANEELQSTNEELQSANEEMETSKEELQSLNEELTTVNAEAEAKALELAHASDDILNLFNSTQIATLFLDNHLRIKRYAESARRLFRLIPSDIGRPLSDLATQLEHVPLQEECRDVLRSLEPKTAEVRTRDGLWFLMRIMPYRTAENAVDGVVATFVDIQPVKSARRTPTLYHEAFHQHPDPMLLINKEGKILEANPVAARWVQRDPSAPDASTVESQLAPKSRTKFQTALRKVLRTKRATELPLSLVPKNKASQTCRFHLLPLAPDAPNEPAVCIVIHPCT